MTSDEVFGAHLIGRVQTGHAIGAVTGDKIVSMTLWAHDIPNKPGKFVMYPDQARVLAQALIDSADKADADLRQEGSDG